MIVVDRYRALTGDTASDEVDVADAITDAVELLEEYLGRELVHGERTETMVADRGGKLWPRVTPIIEAEGWTIDGLGLVGSRVAWHWGEDTIEVTYTGGWADARLDEPEGPALPTGLQRDLANAAYRLLHPQIATHAGILAGADSIRLGDAAVSGKGLSRGESTNAWWSSTTRGYRYEPVSTRPPARESFV